MSPTLKIAGVQMDISIGEVDRNFHCMAEWAEQAASQSAGLIVFPECALSGYCFKSRNEAFPHAQFADGVYTEKFADLCSRLGTCLVFGYLEKTADGRLFNSAALVGPGGLLGNYRKVHLPFLGVDRFTTPGDQPFQIHALEPTAEAAKIGLNICYDTSFPETARVMSLQGADLIVLPTNWPRGAEGTARHIINARSLENHVFFMAVNRIGTERGFSFIGQSRICDCMGNDLALADHVEEAIITAEIEFATARIKSTINVPGEYELHRLADRRPEFYSSLSQDQPKSFSRGTDNE